MPARKNASLFLQVSAMLPIGFLAVWTTLLSGCRSTPVPDFWKETDTRGSQPSATRPVAVASDAGRTSLLVDPPAGLSVSDNGLRSAVLSWMPPTDNAYRYRVERAESADGPFTRVEDVPPQRGQYTDGDTSLLKDSSTYYYRLTAVLDKSGTLGEASAVVKTTTAPPPVPPLNLQATASGSRAVTLVWTPSASEGVTAYRIARTLLAAPDAFEPAGTVRMPPFIDGGTPATTLRDSTAYRYRVTAVNRVGAESLPSAAAEVVTLPPPIPVRNVIATSQEVRCVPLTWETHPATDIVRYDIYHARVETEPFTKIGSVTGRLNTRFTDGGTNPGNLEDEGTYYYRVRAINAVTAESGDSQTARAITRAVPAEVAQVKAVSDRPREIPLSWALAADEAVVGYEVWRAEAELDDWAQIVRLNSRTTTAFTDRGTIKDGTQLGNLKDGTEYHYKVIAFNTGNVRSSASDPVTARTKYSPAAPVDLIATTNRAHTIHLAWQSNPEADVNAYLVESSRRPTDGFRRLAIVRAAEGNVQTATELELAPAELRHFRVKALDKEGLESTWSAVASGRAKPLPDAPAELQTQFESGRVRLTWQRPRQADIVSYNVWAKRFLFGWTLIGTCEQAEYIFDRADLAKELTVAVTSIDESKLESEKSAAIKIPPMMP